MKPLSERLLTELTQFRTLALREALANDPATAQIAVLHALTLGLFYRFASDTCLEITAKSAGFSQPAPGLSDSAPAHAIQRRHEHWATRLPESPAALWDALLHLNGDERQDLLAHCAGLAVNAVHEPWNRRQGALGHADRLAQATELDVAAVGWKPTVENYLGRVTKARILDAVRETRGEHAAQLLDHLKKGDMAREAERLLDGTGWLPEILRTPGSGDGALDGAAEPEDGDEALPPFLADAAE